MVSLVVLVSVFGSSAPLGDTKLALAAVAADLATAENFSVLAGSAISDAGGSLVDEDIGLSPTTGAAVTGIIAGQVGGTIYVVDAMGPAGSVEDPGLLSTAKDDLSDAYDDLEGQVSDGVVGAIGAGQTLLPGVYTSGSTILLTGSLTLDAQGDPNAVFIFQAGSSLTTGSDSTILLEGDAQACNVFWQVGSSATLGTNSTFKGNILALSSITDDGGSNVEGRLLAQDAAVTLNNTDIEVPPCVVAPVPATLHVVKVVTNDDGGVSVPADFTLRVLSGGVDVAGSPATGTSTPGSAYTLPAGTYSVAEDASAGYTHTFSGDCAADGSITLTAGQDATCTVTNDDVAPAPPGTGTLRVVKVVTNDDGGVSVASGFALHVRSFGVDVAGSPAAGVAAPGTSYTLAAGTYAVSEDASAGYTHTFSGDCDVNGVIAIGVGDDATCVIMNDDTASAGSSGGGGSRRRTADTTDSTAEPASTVSSTTPVALFPTAFPGFPNTGIGPMQDISSLSNGAYLRSIGMHHSIDPEIPVRIRIPSIRVDVALESVGLTTSGALEAPSNPMHAAWFNHGPLPGDVGTAVIDGHYGWRSGVSSVFDTLERVQVGDKLYVEDGAGVVTTFIVREFRTYGAEEKIPQVFDSHDGAAHLNLITCAGLWDKVKQSYAERLVVFADKE